jgi:hypothetical protein
MDIPTVRAICARVVELGRHAVQGDIAANVATIRAEIPDDALVDSIKGPASFRPGPDALLWGLPRSGTSWLHWHLFRDANVTKSAFKEINFLHTIGIAEGYFGQEGAAIDWAIAYDRLTAQYTQWLDDDFLGYAIRELVFLLGPRDWDWYRLLTGGYGETKGIDLTPLNYLMTQATASHVKEIGPGVLTFALLRDPLEQIVSFWRHELHKTHALTDDGVYLQAHDVGRWLWGRRLRAIIGELRDLRLFYYDELRADPARLFERITDMLGVSRFRAAEGIATRVNESSDGLRVRFSRGAMEAIREDAEHLDGIVDPARLNEWRRSLDRALPTRWASLSIDDAMRWWRARRR